MMHVAAVAALFPDLQAVELDAWIERRWVEPEAGPEGGLLFQEIDVARVRLIYDLRHDLAVAEDTVPLILSLIDQVYELRCQLKAVSRAVDTLPEALREQVLTALDQAAGYH
jgi:chaperone modulatory protein CbpM